MGHSIGRTALTQLQSRLQGFLQDGAVPFSSVLTVHAIVALISQTCAETCAGPRATFAADLRLLQSAPTPA